MVDKFKQIFRETCQIIRAKLPINYQHTISSQICNRIITLDAYRKAKHIALYQAFNGEIRLDDIWKKAPLQGKYCYFPVIREDLTLCFLPATPNTTFKKNKFNILEPDVSLEWMKSPDELDIIFMPLVAFDVNGSRIGMGKGYYDRALKDVSHPALIGLAYEFQKQIYIQPEPWDIPLHTIITETNIYSVDPRFSKKF